MERRLSDQLLADLRAWMEEQGIDVLIVPKADAHHVEWLRPHKNFVARLSGFEGSYGRLAIWRDRHVLVTSGIYLEAATAALEPLGYEIVDDDGTSWLDWLASHLKAGARVGFDPWLHTMAEYALAQKAIEAGDAVLVTVDDNPIDRIAPQAARQPTQFFPHAIRYAGVDAATKRSQIGKTLRERGSDTCLLSAPDSICWLLNIRGNETFDAPLAFGFALIAADGSVELFLGPDGISAKLKEHFGEGVSLHSLDRVGAYPEMLPQGATVELDANRTSEALALIARRAGCAIIDRADPCQEPKAIKNTVEIAGARAAHCRDGIAQVKFWHWLEARLRSGDLPTEAEAERRIDGLRSELDLHHSVSFRTIAGAGANGSMPHYHSDLTRDIPFVPDSFFLLDSGGQFLDGTTDVTRTWSIGEPSPEARLHYTLVLKGMIDAHVLRFPKGTRGYMIDAAARRPLWTVGLDYPHGTGHGVGSFLGVHEYPIRLRTKPDPEPLLEGMITSIEPGYYRAGHYGIRLENLVCVQPDAENPDLLGFETLTMCPFDLGPVIWSELEPLHIAWLDEYHKTVREQISPHLAGKALAWLRERTRPVAEQRLVQV